MSASPTDEVYHRFLPPRDPKGDAFRATRFDFGLRPPLKMTAEIAVSTNRKTAPRGARFLCCQYIIEEDVAKLRLDKHEIAMKMILKSKEIVHLIFLLIIFLPSHSNLIVLFIVVYFPINIVREHPSTMFSPLSFFTVTSTL